MRMFAGRDGHAAGHSASNWHENPQTHIVAATAGAFLPCNKHVEPSFTGKGQPASDIDAGIMRKNLLHEQASARSCAWSRP